MTSRIEGSGAFIPPPNNETRIARTFKTGLEDFAYAFANLNPHDPSQITKLASSALYLASIAKEAETC